jgi:hypothetical protein
MEIPLPNDPNAANTCKATAAKAVNKLIHHISLDTEGPHVRAWIAAIEALGYTRTAEVLRERVAPAVVHVATEGDHLEVATEVKDREGPVFEVLLNALRGVPGRHWNGEKKVNEFPVSSKGALWGALRLVLPRGSVIVGTRTVVL